MTTILKSGRAIARMLSPDAGVYEVFDGGINHLHDQHTAEKVLVRVFIVSPYNNF